MKGILFVLGMIGLTLGISGGQKADAGVNVAGSIVTPNVAVSLAYFEDELAPYGQWVDVPNYGSAWSPYGVANDWRPYWDGSWAYTDYGWTWVSYEPFGWATYHYGRWVFDPYYGWVWIPDTVWGPAWVSWQYNDNWCGWAALPPSAGWSVSVGFHWVDNDYYVPSKSWCFVEKNRFCDYNVRYACAPVYRNDSLCNQTWDATRYSKYKGKPFNRGFDVDHVGQWTGKRVDRENIADLAKSRAKFAERAEVAREQIRGGESRSSAGKERPNRELQSRGRERKLNAEQSRQFQNRGRGSQLEARELRQKQQVQGRGREQQPEAQRQEQRLQSRGRERQETAQRQEQQVRGRNRERQLGAQRQEQRLQSRGRERQGTAQRQEQQVRGRNRERQLEAQRQEQRLQSRGRERQQLEAQRQEQRLQSRGRERQMEAQRQERQLRGRERQMNTQERQLQKGRNARPDASDSPRRLQKNERKAPAGSAVVEKQSKNENSTEEAAGNGKGRGRGH